MCGSNSTYSWRLIADSEWINGLALGLLTKEQPILLLPTNSVPYPILSIATKIYFIGPERGGTHKDFIMIIASDPHTEGCWCGRFIESHEKLLHMQICTLLIDKALWQDSSSLPEVVGWQAALWELHCEVLGFCSFMEHHTELSNECSDENKVGSCSVKPVLINQLLKPEDACRSKHTKQPRCLSQLCSICSLQLKGL